MQTKIESITPEKAESYLEANRDNFRKVDSRRVDIYAREMKNGEWQLNGESIKFNGTQLLDGQHRLCAVIKSGVTVTMLVIRDIEADGRSIDRGKPRSVGQWLAHEGFQNAAATAAMSRLVVFYENGDWGRQNIQPSSVVDSEVIAKAEMHKAAMAECITLCQKTRRILPSSLVGAVVFIGSRELSTDVSSSNEVQWFLERLADGTELTTADAVYYLRLRMQQQTTRSKLSMFMKRAYLTIAWNRTMLGLECKPVNMQIRLTGPAKEEAPDRIEQAPDNTI